CGSRASCSRTLRRAQCGERAERSRTPGVEVEVMKTVGLVVLGLALGVPVWADDIYRWTDAAGGVHYANAPHRQATNGDAVAPGEEREQRAQHALEVKGVAVKLRDEVTARVGETPAWWIDVR